MSLHPAENLLLQYAQVRCLVLVGRDWNPDETEASVTKGPHSSALEFDSIAKIQVESRETAQGFATILRWDDIKKNTVKLKIFTVGNDTAHHQKI